MKVFDLPQLEKTIGELLAVSSEPGFWERADAQEISRELAQLQGRRDGWLEMDAEIRELDLLAELYAESEDRDLFSEFYERAKQFEKRMEERQTLILMDEEFDSADAIVTVHAGAGGLDAQDWTEILYRMYFRWGEDHRYSIRLLDEQPAPEAGFKSVTFEMKGQYAYGYMKGEQGVHRLVRISPFDSARRRHTSFASVEVLPVLPDSVEVEIRPEDLRVDTFRSSGAGGQHVNMTDSAIRITHIPSGIVVSCQVERSQHMNRASAMQVLRSKLFEKTLRERQAQIESLQGEKRVIAWGSQIRSYTLQPFQLIKDHRSGCSVGNVQAVLDGDLDTLMMAWLCFYKTGKTVSDGGNASEEMDE